MLSSSQIQGGNITIRIELEAQNDTDVTLHFSIKDTGIGMSDKQLKKLFQPFAQADASTTRKYGGSGLGLVICQKLVNFMDGEIWVESKLGKGSTFHFTSRFAKSSIKDKTDKLSNGETQEAQNSVDEHSIAKIHGKHVLLVEDNEINQELAVDLLNSIGVSVRVAENGAEAIESLEEEHFDAILMDCQMPVMDGYTATQKIRSDGRFSRLPILALTANVLDEERDKALKAGMNDLVLKPIEPMLMFATLAKWIIATNSTAQSIRQSKKVDDGSLPYIEGLDTSQGLIATQNNTVLYIKLLKIFVKNQSDFEKEFLSALEANDMKSAERVVHTLKGVAGTIGADEVFNNATTLELACKEDIDIGNIKSKLEHVILSLKSLLKELETFLDER